jgi:hypothetical protein
MNGQTSSSAVGNRYVQVYKNPIIRKKGQKGKSATPSDTKKLEKVMMAFIDQLDVICPMADADSFDIRKVLHNINNDVTISDEFESSFGFHPGIMSKVLDSSDLNSKIEQLNFYTLKKISIIKQTFLN